MRLPAAFLRLPLTFDAERLRHEIRQFEAAIWQPHPQGFAGNASLPLVSVGGGDNDATRGLMQPAPRLRDCPYLRQVLAAFGTVVGRSRLMRLAPGAGIAPHFDAHYYWHDRVRVHIPISSDAAVRFRCGGEEVHMAPGEAWLLDNWRIHGVVNPSATTRIHLVFDTVGSAAFWDLAEQAGAPARTVPFDPQVDARFPTERCNLPEVMPPAELSALIAEALADAAPEGPEQAEALARFTARSTRHLRDWRATWAAHGEQLEGRPAFRGLQERLLATLAELPADLRVHSNGSRLVNVLQPLLQAAFNPRIAGEVRRPAVAVGTS